MCDASFVSSDHDALLPAAPERQVSHSDDHILSKWMTFTTECFQARSERVIFSALNSPLPLKEVLLVPVEPAFTLFTLISIIRLVFPILSEARTEQKTVLTDVAMLK